MNKRDGIIIKLRVVIILILAAVIFLLMVLADYPRIVEHYYAQGLYPYICMALHPVLNLLPFSLGDVLYIAVVLFLVYAFIRFIKLLFKRRFKPAVRLLLGIVTGVQAGIIVFYLFWGMNYFRLPAAQRLGLQDTVYNINELKAVTLLLIDSANTSRSRLTPADMRQGNDSIYHTAIAAVNNLSARSANFTTHSAGIKPSLLSPFMNYLGTSGYYNPFTTEAQINYGMPVFIKPFVACHELSHQIGFAPEDEANFAGFIAGQRSGNRLLRYSAYYEGMSEFMYALQGTDSVEYKLYKKKISKQVMGDLKQEHAYWTYYSGKLEEMSSVFYDNFLKANNQPEGLLTYNRMITLVMACYRKDHPEIINER